MSENAASIVPLPVDSSARDYLQEMDVAPILEAFVTDLVQKRPKDVLTFMRQWAKNGSTTEVPDGDTVEDGDADGDGTDAQDEEQQKVVDADVEQKKEDLLALQSLAVRQSWVSVEQSEGGTAALAKTFFTVITAQHASLKRNLLKDADYGFLESQLISHLAGVVKGTLTTEEVQAAAGSYGVGLGLEARHYHYFITAMLSALSIHLKDDFRAVGEAWRVVLTEITTIVESQVETDTAIEKGDRDDSIVQCESSASSAVQASWKNIEDKAKNVGAQFFNILTLQHAVLKRTVFKGVDMGNASEKLVELLDGVVSGSTSTELLESLGVAHAADYGVDSAKHGPYFITTMLTVLKINLGDDFAAVAESWRLVLTGITDAVSNGADALEAEQTMTAEAVEPKEEEAGTQDGGDLVKENWKAIEDKKAFVQTFLKLIVTQHPVVERSLLKGVDQDKFVDESFLPMFDQFITGSLPDADVQEKAVQHGKDKKMQERFYHYFITAMLTTVQMNVNKADFGLSADLWRLKLTHLTNLIQNSLATLEAKEDETAKEGETAKEDETAKKE